MKQLKQDKLTYGDKVLHLKKQLNKKLKELEYIENYNKELSESQNRTMKILKQDLKEAISKKKHEIELKEDKLKK